MKSDVLEQLLPYYQRELTCLREMGSTFAQAYPKVAGRLELGGGESPDPHVERLLESFAFLTARIQRDIESEFPKISSGLLDVLCPQFLRPVPAMAIAHVGVDPEQGKILSGFDLKRDTPLFAQAPSGELCRFRTCSDTVLWPFAIKEAAFESPADYLEASGRVTTVLRLRVECEAGLFEEFEVDTLRIHLAGDRTVATVLYELIFAHLSDVLLTPQGRKQPLPLSQGAITIKPVGFARDEAMLPYPSNAHDGYRLIQEYFTFPEKFLFFDLENLRGHLKGKYTDIVILLEEGPPQKVAIAPKHFMLNCAPIINLFRKTTEPIRVGQRQVAYPLVPDGRRKRSTEIHSILKISASSAADDETQDVQPYFSFDHRASGREPTVFWHARRGPPKLPDMPGTDVEVTFTDLAFRPTTPATQVVYAHTLCTNRHLPEVLRDGTLLQLEVAAPVMENGIYCLSKPTRPIDPPLGGPVLWKLISHLSLNYLSLTQGKDSLTALREILRLYGNVIKRDVSLQINGLRKMTTRRVVRRMGKEAWRGFCEGTEVTLRIDERNYSGGEGFLLASVLNHFLALYASVNSFTELVLVAEGDQREGPWKRWQPMAGEQIIL